MPRQKRQQLKQRPDGRFVCYYHDIAFYGSTSDEALWKREKFKADERRAATRPMTVSRYIEKWLPLYKSGVSTKCYNDYAKQMEAMSNSIGGKLLSQVTVDDIMGVYMHFQGYSASTIKRARMLYIAFFDAAVDNGYCLSNPCRSALAKPPKGTKGSHRAITDEERQLILSTPHRFRLGALIMLYAGLRRGEVMALRAEDFDREKGVIHVRKAIRFDSNQGIVALPKTEAGTRDVPILPPVMDAISGLEGLVLHGAARPDAYCSDMAFRRGWASWLHALERAAGHPVCIRPHDLRHSYCTMLRDAGVDLKQAMIWMGHADEKMILQIYDHVTDRRQDDSIRKVLSLILNGQIGGQDG